MSTALTDSVEQHKNASLSLKMLLDARPDAAELIEQAYRAGFVDGALHQSTTMLRAFDNAKAA